MDAIFKNPADAAARGKRGI
jgi:hypothetical protein